MPRERRRRTGIHLSYSRTLCTCSELRITGTTCPVCHFRPPAHEVNQSVQRRKRHSRSIRAITPDPSSTFSSTGVSVYLKVIESVDGWMENFWAALNDADQDFASVERQTLILLDTIAAFRKVEALRPWRALYRSHDEMLTALYRVFDFSLVAYAAETPIEAQEAQRKMQGQIDICADAISGWRKALNQLSELIGATPEDQFIIATAAGFQEGNDSGLFVSKLLDSLDLPKHPFPGAANIMTSCVELCTMLGERKAFADTISTMLNVLRKDPIKGKRILSSPQFCENFARSLGDTYRSGTILHILAALSGNEKLAVDAVVDAGHSIVESSTRYPLALVASLLGPMGYKRWLEIGANECIRYVANQGYSSLVSDLSLDLRNAKSHRAYRLTHDGGIDIHNNRGNFKSHLSAEQIVDAVVAGHVLFLGLALGVLLFACDVKADVMMLIADVDDMPAVYSIQYAALSNGWPLPSVHASEEYADTLIITPCPPIHVSTDNEQSKAFVVATTIGRRLSSEASFILFCDREDAPLLMDIRRANKFFDNDDPAEASLLYIEFVHSLRRGDLRGISDNEWHKLLSIHTERAAAGMDGDAIRRLRKLRVIVQGCDDNQFAEKIASVIRNIRTRLSSKEMVSQRLDLLSLPTSRPPTWITRVDR